MLRLLTELRSLKSFTVNFGDAESKPLNKIKGHIVSIFLEMNNQKVFSFIKPECVSNRP